MSLDPHALLLTVHADLAKVIIHAAQVPQAFMVIYGIRSAADEAAAVASGHSLTLHSRHLADVRDGLARAVDVAALTNSHIDWNTDCYPAIAAQIKAAAHSLTIPIEWGGDWVSFKDWGHFQLPWASYP